MRKVKTKWICIRNGKLNLDRILALLCFTEFVSKRIWFSILIAKSFLIAHRFIKIKYIFFGYYYVFAVRFSEFSNGETTSGVAADKTQLLVLEKMNECVELCLPRFTSLGHLFFFFLFIKLFKIKHLSRNSHFLSLSLSFYITTYFIASYSHLWVPLPLILPPKLIHF